MKLDNVMQKVLTEKVLSSMENIHLCKRLYFLMGLVLHFISFTRFLITTSIKFSPILSIALRCSHAFGLSLKFNQELTSLIVHKLLANLKLCHG